MILCCLIDFGFCFMPCNVYRHSQWKEFVYLNVSAVIQKNCEALLQEVDEYDFYFGEYSCTNTMSS